MREEGEASQTLRCRCNGSQSYRFHNQEACIIHRQTQRSGVSQSASFRPSPVIPRFRCPNSPFLSLPSLLSSHRNDRRKFFSYKTASNHTKVTAIVVIAGRSAVLPSSQIKLHRSPKISAQKLAEAAILPWKLHPNLVIPHL